MRVQQPVRDRDISLQQSAVHQALASNSSLAKEDKEKLEYNASLHAQSLQQANSISTTTAAQKPPDSSTPPTLGPLRSLTRKYSFWDTSWIKPVLLYYKYYVISRLPPTYRNWRGYLSNDLGFGVIKYRLPSQCRVLMIGDWGTHMPDNVALLRQAVTKFRPNAIIHLGDVYYSGTVEECAENVLDVMDEIFSDMRLAMELSVLKRK